jgi:hypothetical protein
MQTFEQLLESDNASWSIVGGIDELVPMGEFYLRDFSIDTVGEYRQFRLSLQDESALIAERKSTMPRIYTGEVSIVCQQILRATGRTLAFDAETVGPIITYALEHNRDPWATVESILTGYGYECLMSRTGEVLIRRIQEHPDMTAEDMSLLVLSKQETHSRRTCNHVVVTSTSDSGSTFRGDFYDNDPTSKGFWARYGDVPQFFEVQGLNSAQECYEAARRLAPKLFQRARSDTFAMLQNVKMDLGWTALVGDYIYTADQLSFNFSADSPMYVTGRGFSYAR